MFNRTLLILSFICLISCTKDSSSPTVNYIGVYVGNLEATQSSLNTKSTISNCRVILTSGGTDGKVIIAADKLFSYTVAGKISGNSLVIGPEDINYSSNLRLNLYGNATFSGNSMSIEIKQDDYLKEKDYPNGRLYYQTSWKGTMSKQ
jgi:hypothetical protein